MDEIQNVSGTQGGELKTDSGKEAWVVSWNSLVTRDYNDPSLVMSVRRAKSFLTKQDAKAFAESLHMAMEHLQCGFRIGVTIEKQV